ncbi:MAG: biotin-dependent carboxyltransferase [Schwartzia sp.]|nr:biotin-dependent carboxyltransferase [Schwartzia sp. (in: firmicutes)]MBR1552743.1 biotin-dependent carboxyltransferase [Schwartzia sp. (in: firmicutes)]
MSILVKTPGPLTTVQDAGRFGYQSSGIRPSGVMDAAAYEAANALVGNGNGEAVLEMTFLGATLTFQDAAWVALTGADMAATLDGAPVERYRAIKIAAGQTLAVGMAASGCRGYLAVRGGIDVPPVMGSRATDIGAKLGGFAGRALKAGDLLPTRAADSWTPTDVRCAPPVYESEITVRVIPGPQAEYFTAAGTETFFASRYEVSPNSDRMGIRFDGAAIESAGGTDIVSDGIVFGSVQVPSGGVPIVLMADHQTTGGYAKIGTVLSFDLPKLAQARPGDTVRFTRISAEEAQQLYTK